MGRRALLALIASTALVASSCSSVEGITGSDDPSPTHSSKGLLLTAEDVPGGDEWQEVDGITLEGHLMDNPAETLGVEIDPPGCTDDGSITEPRASGDADVAGLLNASMGETTDVLIVVLKGARSADAVRDAREPCDGATLSNAQIVVRQTETVSDGPDVEGSDNSFALDTTWSPATGGTSQAALTRYTLVAEIRETLAVVVITTDATASETSISDDVKAEAVVMLTAQVDEIASAP